MRSHCRGAGHRRSAIPDKGLSVALATAVGYGIHEMPNYPHIAAYYARRQELVEFGGSDNELNIRPAFQNCLVLQSRFAGGSHVADHAASYEAVIQAVAATL